MGPASSRDQKRQSRMIRGCGGKFLQFFSINHHDRIAEHSRDGSPTTKAQVRLDATIDLKTGTLTYAEDDNDASDVSNSDKSPSKDPDWFQAYVPQSEDGCYLEDPDGSITCDLKKVCWWHMSDGKVLGLHEEQLVEYDEETLSPLGVVVTKDKLAVSGDAGGTKEVLVVQNKSILVLVDDKTREMEVIHPNADGSYWRKFQRNKKIRLEEKGREKVARRWFAQNLSTNHER